MLSGVSYSSYWWCCKQAWIREMECLLATVSRNSIIIYIRSHASTATTKSTNLYLYREECLVRKEPSLALCSLTQSFWFNTRIYQIRSSMIQFWCHAEFMVQLILLQSCCDWQKPVTFSGGWFMKDTEESKEIKIGNAITASISS